MRERHLAGTKTVDANAALELPQPFRHPCLEIGRRDRDVEFALETVGNTFSDLHGDYLEGLRPLAAGFEFISLRLRMFLSENRKPLFRNMREGQAAPGVVRAEGLEPPRLSSREPKSRASTNSATPADSVYGRRTHKPGGGAYISREPAAHAKNPRGDGTR